MSTPAFLPAAPHPVVTAATGLMSVLWFAELRSLPMPFATRAYEVDSRIELQFHTVAEVEAWAEAMDVDLDQDRTTATGVLLDTPLTVCAWVPAEVTS